MQIVREQCWLNGMLEGIKWSVESLDAGVTNSEGQEEAEATEAELDSILSGNLLDSMCVFIFKMLSIFHLGTFVPLKVPVNVYIPPTSVGVLPNPTILMTCPEQSPGSGLIEIAVHWDENKERGVGVEVRSPEWRIGSEGEVTKLEEICRRGGVWALAGLFWTHLTR
jgi:hypothetical protein